LDARRLLFIERG